MRPVTFVKWGGSLITDKTGHFTVRTNVLQRLAEELARYRNEAPNAPLVLGHGSGSFGHVAAHEAGLDGSTPPEDLAQALSCVQRAVSELHKHVMQSLRDARLPAFSFAPSSATTAASGTPHTLNAAPVQRALSVGALPVTYGDILLDTERGLSICSTETIFRALIDALDAAGTPVAQVLWCGSTDGVYDTDGHTLSTLTAAQARAIANDVHAPRGTDVTGGMALRLRTASALAAQGIGSLLLNGDTPGHLAAALRQEDIPGTRIATIDEP